MLHNKLVLVIVSFILMLNIHAQAYADVEEVYLQINGEGLPDGSDPILEPISEISAAIPDDGMVEATFSTCSGSIAVSVGPTHYPFSDIEEVVWTASKHVSTLSLRRTSDRQTEISSYDAPWMLNHSHTYSFFTNMAKLDPSGAAFVYSTYLGSSGHEGALGLAVDVLGYVRGYTLSRGYAPSPDFPTQNPLQSASLSIANLSVVASDASYQGRLETVTIPADEVVVVHLSKHMRSGAFSNTTAMLLTHSTSEDRENQWGNAYLREGLSPSSDRLINTRAGIGQFSNWSDTQRWPGLEGADMVTTSVNGCDFFSSSAVSKTSPIDPAGSWTGIGVPRKQESPSDN